MAAASLLQIPQAEVPRLQEAMRDLQSSVASFYAETARSNEELGRWLRMFLATAQVVNDLLTNVSSQSAAYVALFSTRSAPGVDLIEGVKYARNVDQHVSHIVEPGEWALIGGLHGYRSYVPWDEIPVTAHNDLRPSTQSLKPCYDAELRGKAVTKAMMGVLRFYASLDPAIIHRDHRGEWTAGTSVGWSATRPGTTSSTST